MLAGTRCKGKRKAPPPPVVGICLGPPALGRSLVGAVVGILRPLVPLPGTLVGPLAVHRQLRGSEDPAQEGKARTGSQGRLARLGLHGPVSRLVPMAGPRRAGRTPATGLYAFSRPGTPVGQTLDPLPVGPSWTR
jgi:hypothetical protein